MGWVEWNGSKSHVRSVDIMSALSGESIGRATAS